MKESTVGPSVRPHGLNDQEKVRHNSGSAYPPAQFFKEAGTVIAICLALGLLAQVLVLIAGPH